MPQKYRGVYMQFKGQTAISLKNLNFSGLGCKCMYVFYQLICELTRVASNKRQLGLMN